MKIEGRQAFTLIEIVAAISIFALIVVGVAAAMSQTNRIIDRLSNRRESVASAQIAIDRLSRELEMAYQESNLKQAKTLFVGREVGSGPELTFSYLDSEIKTLFVNRTPGVQIASFTLQKAEDGSFDLIRSETPIYAADKIQDSRSSVLAHGVLSWKAQYYDPRNDQWIEEWDSGGNRQGGYFPTAVKLQFEVVDPTIPKEDWKKKSMLFETSVRILNN